MRGAARQPFNQAYGRFAKIGKRRGISVSSHDNQSHYLHPHPYRWGVESGGGRTATPRAAETAARCCTSSARSPTATSRRNNCTAPPAQCTTRTLSRRPIVCRQSPTARKFGRQLCSRLWRDLVPRSKQGSDRSTEPVWTADPVGRGGFATERTSMSGGPFQDLAEAMRQLSITMVSRPLP
jgi:hypothetical protein